MTSLLQHHGGMSPDRTKVELLFEVTTPNPKYPDSQICGNRSDPFVGSDGKTYYRLWRIYRKPAGMWGPWVVFRWLGEKHAPDLSVPISTFRLPRDAKRLTDEECEAYWKS